MSSQTPIRLPSLLVPILRYPHLNSRPPLAAARSLRAGEVTSTAPGLAYIYISTRAAMKSYEAGCCRCRAACHQTCRMSMLSRTNGKITTFLLFSVNFPDIPLSVHGSRFTVYINCRTVLVGPDSVSESRRKVSFRFIDHRAGNETNNETNNDILELTSQSVSNETNNETIHDAEADKNSCDFIVILQSILQ